MTSIFFFYDNFSTAISPRVVNSFPDKPWFLCVSNTILLKTLWEKKKLLITSNFFFFHSVFYPFQELFAVFINFKLLSVNSFNLEESKTCHLEKS